MSIKIYQATTDDIPDIAAIHIAGWQASYTGLMDQDYLDSFTIPKRIKDWQGRFEETQNVIMYKDGVAAGFTSFGPLKNPPPGSSKIRPLYSSEIYAIYLMPEFHRQGLGTKLFKGTVEFLKEQKHQSLCLWGLEANKRARAFYEHLGGQRIGKKKTDFGPSRLNEVCYGWRDIKTITET
ncbi:MAG: GNAT family N-acetyltransferase [Alphaproteobacteria bacterium]|nr:GNAT family N-acetyltransferase [Alphaproteobacteria bacterium]